MNRLLLLLIISILSTSKVSSQIQFIEDIRLGADSSNPRGFVEFQNKVYFIADNSAGNNSIFSIDINGNVTEANTFNFSVKILKLIPLNGQLYATVRSIIQPTGDFSEPEIWRINLFGVDEKIRPFCGNYFFYVYDSFIFNNEVYLSASTSCLTNGFKQLYRYNGTTVTLVEAVNPSGDFNPQDFAIHNNELYFRGFTSENGYELYKTNGTSVSLAYEFLLGPNSSFPVSMTSYNGFLYFGLLNETSNIQLFKLETSSSTATAFGIILNNDMKVFNNELYYSDRNTNTNINQLAKLDTNDNRTFITLSNPSEDAIAINFFEVLNGTLYFNVSKPSTGYELYRYTSGAFAQIIDDYYSGSVGSNSFYKFGFNNILYFGANDGNGLGIELHKYEPVATTQIADSNFEQLLINLGFDYGNIDGEVPTANIDNVTVLDIPSSNISNMSISNLDGIEDFTDLEEFSLFLNSVSDIDFSSNTNLKKVTIYNNPLVSINLTQNPLLTDLIISNTSGLTFNNIDLTQNSILSLLDLSSNNISAINISGNPQLKTFRIGNNPINTLELSQNTALEILSSWSTRISNLDLSNHPNLKELISYSGELSILNLKNGNNNNLNSIFITDNPNLSCITVDNVSNAQNNSNWIKDETTAYSTNCSILGINDIELDESLFSLSPNPTKEFLKITLDNNFDDLTSSIYDLTGKLISVNNHKNNSDKRVDVSKLEIGVYFINIKINNRSTTKRFIKI